jgi:hypothetical protein
MRIEQRKEIADAVLYEGYLLYPYRRSAIKNRQRWTIGVVYPKEFSEANGGIEPWTMRTECLVSTQGNRDTSLDIYVRFLHLLSVQRGEADRATREGTPGSYNGADVGAQFIDPWELAASRAFDTWEEAREREVIVPNLSLSDLVAHPRTIAISFPGERIKEEPVGNSQATVREQKPLLGAIIVAAELVGEDLFRFSVQIENRTPDTGRVTSRGDFIVLQSFVSTHTLLFVHEGAFISLLEPPEALQPLAQGCQNLRTWPVLVGNKGEDDGMLSSPIILYDYPQIAPESPGPLFDGTEIDELLTLRILTLTEEEKREMREGDERAREILERTENMSAEQFMKLHGVIRGLRAVEEGGGA